MPSTWEPPEVFKVPPGRGRATVSELFTAARVTVVDPIHEIVDELCQLRIFTGRAGGESKDQMAARYLAEGDAFGSWVYFPWEHTMVRYPDPDDYYELRTFRNRHLVTADEHAILRNQTLAFFGLSVGRRILSQLAQSGIGNRYLFGDPDTISVTNLNRLQSSMSEVGLSKTESTARELGKVDPYLEQVHLADGYSDDAQSAMESARPLVILEEVDNPGIKATIRAWAWENRVPVVMATDVGDVSVIHVERYDTEDIRPFNDRVSDAVFESLLEGTLSGPQAIAALLDIAGRREALSSTRLIRSFLDVGRGLAGLAQLGTTVGLGASLATTAVREIALGRPLPSGSYAADPYQILALSQPDSASEREATLQAFATALGMLTDDGG